MQQPMMINPNIQRHSATPKNQNQFMNNQFNPPNPSTSVPYNTNPSMGMSNAIQVSAANPFMPMQQPQPSGMMLVLPPPQQPQQPQPMYFMPFGAPQIAPVNTQTFAGGQTFMVPYNPYPQPQPQIVQTQPQIIQAQLPPQPQYYQIQPPQPQLQMQSIQQQQPSQNTQPQQSFINNNNTGNSNNINSNVVRNGLVSDALLSSTLNPSSNSYMHQALPPSHMLADGARRPSILRKNPSMASLRQNDQPPLLMSTVRPQKTNISTENIDSGLFQQKRAADYKSQISSSYSSAQTLPQQQQQQQPQQQLAQLYRYQKSTTAIADDLKHPIEKYKDLIYKPRESRQSGENLTSLEMQMQRPPLLMPPLLASSRPDISGRRPILQGELRLPLDRVIFFFCNS